MRQTIRDNIIYLAVALVIVTLVAGDFFYAESHGHRMWTPSWFAARAAYTTALLAYFVVRQTIKTKVRFAYLMVSVLVVSIVHIGLAFTFRHFLAHLSTAVFAPLAIAEMLILVVLATHLARHLKARSG